MNNINEKAKIDFLIYANAVIKSRAISAGADNLKPVQRRVLYTLSEMKLTSDKKTTKCANVVGNCMVYHPHGDASIYDALIHLSQWWKMRYPLINVQGNSGNIIGDGAAAMRYTECKLSKVGDLMLDEINKNCVKFKPNYDDSHTEPCYLPSKFPNVLCNGNNGIAVGMSSNLVPHNYNEVADAIQYYLAHKDCSVADLLQFIKGPDFPTGGIITNGEEIQTFYETGVGNFKVRGNYTIEKISGNRVQIVFSDIPFLTELESGIINPMKKLVLEKGYNDFEDIFYEIVDGRPKVYIVLAKGANVEDMLDVLFTKTRLAATIKLNNTIIEDGEPKLYNLKQMIEAYVDHRHEIISQIARNDLEKALHKLTVVIGLQKCLSDIDKLIALIRGADNRDAAKRAIEKEFVLSDEQADAVLDMKLSRLSRLDVKELEDDEANYRNEVSRQRDIIGNEMTRAKIISTQLEEMRSICGDARLTKIQVNADNLPIDEQVVKQYFVNADRTLSTEVKENSTQVIRTRDPKKVFVYNGEGDIGPLKGNVDFIAASTYGNKDYLVFVTRNGFVKVTQQLAYSFKKESKGIKLKDDDAVVFCGEMAETDSILLFDGEKTLRLPFSALSVSGKLTQGSKSGFVNIVSAAVINDGDVLFMMTSDNKAKLTSGRNFSIDNRGNQGETVAEGTRIIMVATDRDTLYLVPSAGKIAPFALSKLSMKGKKGVGAAITAKSLKKVL